MYVIELPYHETALIVQTLLIRRECPVASSMEKGALDGLLDSLATQLPEKMWDDERPTCGSQK